MRDLFSSYATRADEVDGIWCQFGVLSSQVRFGEPVPFFLDVDSARILRRRMLLTEDWKLQPTDSVDTILLDRDRYGDFKTSLPMNAGIWRLTLLSEEAFREVYLNVTENDIAVEMDPNGFVLWTGGEARVRLWNRTDTIWRDVGDDGILRESIAPPDSLRVEWNLAVRKGKSVHFRQLSWGRGPSNSRIHAVAWPDRKEYLPGDRVRLHGIVRAFDADGRMDGVDLRGPVRLRLSGRPFSEGWQRDLEVDAEGHFEVHAEIPLDAPDGQVEIGEAIRLDDGLGKALGKTDNPGWLEVGGARDGGNFEVRSSPRRDEIPSSPVPRLHARWGRMEYRQGDVACFRAQVVDGHAKPWRGEVSIRCVNADENSDTILQTNREGMIQMVLPNIETGSVQCLAAARVGDSTLAQGTSAKVWSNAEVPARATPLTISVSIGQGANSPRDVALGSPLEDAPAVVVSRGRRIGAVESGHVTGGWFRASLPSQELGADGRWIGFVRGSDSIESVTISNDDPGGSWAKLSARVHREVQEVTVSLKVTDSRGKGVSSHLSVSVAGNPSASPGFDSFPRWPGGNLHQGIERNFTHREFLPWERWGAQAHGVLVNPWISDRRLKMAKGRPPMAATNFPRRPNPDNPQGIHFDPDDAWEDESTFERFESIGEIPSEAPRSTAYWNGSVKTNWFGNGEVRFKLPPGKQDWYLVIRGTAGEHLLVSHIVKI